MLKEFIHSRSPGPTVMAIDPAFTHTGVVIYNAATFELMRSALIVTEKTDKKTVRVSDDRASRIQEIARCLDELLTANCVGVVAELVSSGSKSSTAATAMGIALASVACFTQFRKLPVEWYTPDSTKKHTCGVANASKKDVMAWAAKMHPELGKSWCNKSGKLLNDFEHVADATAVLYTAMQGQLLKMAAKMKGTNA